MLLASQALAATIELTEFLATASGGKDWLVPDSIQALAKQLLPDLKGLRGQLAAPINRASNEIREFLADLLGEQAAAVVMAAATVPRQAAPCPAVEPGRGTTRRRYGRRAGSRRGTGMRTLVASPRQMRRRVGARATAVFRTPLEL